MQHASSYLIIAAMWDLVSSQGTEPGQPALELWSPSHWTTREVPETLNFPFTPYLFCALFRQ